MTNLERASLRIEILKLLVKTSNKYSVKSPLDIIIPMPELIATVEEFLFEDTPLERVLMKFEILKAIAEQFPEESIVSLSIFGLTMHLYDAAFNIESVDAFEEFSKSLEDKLLLTTLGYTQTDKEWLSYRCRIPRDENSIESLIEESRFKYLVSV